MTIQARTNGRRKRGAKSQKSLHQTILSELQKNILSGEWPPGHKIPFEHELTAHYRCSRMTVNKVMTQLALAGLIERRRKAGTFVTRPRSQSAILEVQEIRSEVVALGIPYHFKVLELQKRKASSFERERLASSEVKSIVEVVCLHFAGSLAFCLEERLINLNVVPDAASERFEDTAPGAWLTSKIPWTTAEHQIKAINVPPKTARNLQIPSGTACLVIERRTWHADQTVTFVRLTYPGSAHQLAARFTPAETPAAATKDERARK